jgi:plastocyanin
MLFRRQVSVARIVVPVAVVALAIAAAFAVLPGCASKHNGPAAGGAAKELDSGDIGASTTFAHTFANAGTYSYHCKYHAVMTGAVTVDAGAAGMTADVLITTNASPFPAASVKPGGTVTWHNNSAMLHTVTSN